MAIIVGYVTRDEGRAAFERAIEESRLRNVKLNVVHSEPGGTKKSDRVVEATEDLESLRRVLVESEVDFEVRSLARGNDPAEDLIDVAQQVDAEMIVIGLRRRSAVGKLILGSNAQQILLDAPCAVLAVKSSQPRD